MAAVRCKQSKVRFFFGALVGKKWREEDLFHPEALVQGRANQMLQQYKSASQVSVLNFIHQAHPLLLLLVWTALESGITWCHQACIVMYCDALFQACIVMCITPSGDCVKIKDRKERRVCAA